MVNQETLVIGALKIFELYSIFFCFVVVELIQGDLFWILAAIT